MAFRVFVSLLLSSSAFGLAVPSTHQVHEKRDYLPSRWTKGSRVSPYSRLPMRIGLLQNMDGAEGHLMDVSDPESPNFAKYWTAEDVIEAFKPSENTVQTVRDWLTSSGISASRVVHSDNKGWLAFDASGAETERLLHTEFYVHHDSITGSKMPACEAYHVPSHIRDHVDYITPGIRLLAPTGSIEKVHFEESKQLKRRDLLHQLRENPRNYQRPAAPLANSSDLSTCDEAITPACIRALYNITETDKTEPPVAGNAMGIYESAGEYYAQEDLGEWSLPTTNQSLALY